MRRPSAALLFLLLDIFLILLSLFMIVRFSPYFTYYTLMHWGAVGISAVLFGTTAALLYFSHLPATTRWMIARVALPLLIMIPPALFVSLDSAKRGEIVQSREYKPAGVNTLNIEGAIRNNGKVPFRRCRLRVGIWNVSRGATLGETSFFRSSGLSIFGKSSGTMRLGGDENWYDTATVTLFNQPLEPGAVRRFSIVIPAPKRLTTPKTVYTLTCH